MKSPPSIAVQLRIDLRERSHVVNAFQRFLQSPWAPEDCGRGAMMLTISGADENGIYDSDFVPIQPTPRCVEQLQRDMSGRNVAGLLVRSKSGLLARWDFDATDRKRIQIMVYETDPTRADLFTTADLPNTLAQCLETCGLTIPTISLLEFSYQHTVIFAVP